MKLLLTAALLLLTASLVSAEPRDCSEILRYNHTARPPSGVYTIKPIPFGKPIQVYCDMDSDAKPWTVIQRRMDGTVNFYRPWEHYKHGFGDPNGEYWIGLHALHHLLTYWKFELRVCMEDFDWNTAYAHYHYFFVADECDGYTMYALGFKNGGAGDSLRHHYGQNFSTFDNTQHTSHPYCPHQSLGGFWYNRCFHTNPNGVYRWGKWGYHHPQGVVWKTWKGYYYSLKSITMKVRPVH